MKSREKHSFLAKLNSEAKEVQIFFYVFYSLTLITFCTHHWIWFVISFAILTIVFLSINLTSNSLTSSKFLSYSDEYFTENWDSIERQRRALTEYYEILEENENVFVIKTESGNVYKTNLNGCTCSDFLKRNEPCKHMYFVAHKLKVFKYVNRI